MAEPITNVLGTVAIKHCGEYDATMHYEKLNVVTYNGSSYCAKDSTIGNLPTNTTYWDLMAEKGDQGDTGQDGYTPVKGTDYYTQADKEDLETNLATDVTNEVSEQLSDLTSATPLAASSTSDMTDTTRVYVNTTDGHWYWYNGTAWTDGGIYQSTSDHADVEVLKEDMSNLATSLEELATYDGAWWGDSTTLHNTEDFKTIKYKIPSYVTKIHVETYFYANLRVFLSDVEDPTTTALDKSSRDLADPSSNYTQMTHHIKTYDLTESKQYKYAYIPYYVSNGKPIVKGYNLTGFDSLQTQVDDIKEDVVEVSNTMPLGLTPIQTYQGYWKMNGTALNSDSDWTTYKYAIPKGTKKIYIKTKFYAIMATFFTDISDPTVTYPSKQLNSYADPFDPYVTLQEREKTYELDRYYKYVYVPAYTPYGVPTVTAYKSSALDDAWDENNPLNNKKVLVFGDSITYTSSRWRDVFYRITRAEEIGCFAYPGAHLADYNTTTPLDGNYNTEADGNVHNVVCNQVYYWLNNAPEGVNPDIIIISAGTNDYYTSPEQLATDTNVYATTDGWIDVDTINRTTFEGAMRWITSKLRTKHPNAIIVFASPIQSAQDIGESKSIDVFIAKEEKMKRTCNHLSAKLIKATTESGITGEFEANNTNGRYLVDGLHPNDAGGKLLGTYYANALISMLLKDYEWDEHN